MAAAHFDLSDPDAQFFCPSCGAGYAAQAARCAQCEVSLVPRSRIEGLSADRDSAARDSFSLCAVAEPAQAEIFKAHLENAGIRCWSKEHNVLSYPFVFLPGARELFVLQSDLSRAEDILKGLGAVGEGEDGLAVSALQRQARVDLAAAYRIADMQGLSEGICNHFTLLVPGFTDRFLLIPHGLHWSEVTASSLMVVSLDGERIEGEGIVEPTAFHIHAPLHRARPEAQCILHTHMPYATALTLIEGGRLEMSLQTALHFYGRIAYDESYAGIALSCDEGNRLAQVLGGASVLFMKHHGVMVVGPTVADAYHDLYYLERACRAQVLALSTGRQLARVPDGLAEKVARQAQAEQGFAEAHFSALKRLLNRERAGYAD